MAEMAEIDGSRLNCMESNIALLRVKTDGPPRNETRTASSKLVKNAKMKAAPKAGKSSRAVIPATARNQPACNTNTATGLVDCGNWSVSATWNVPANAVSGVYFAHIYTSGATHENQIPFVVTNNASTSNTVFMTSDETWQAYNDWGGYSLYTGDATGSPWCCTALDPGRATQVSYNRPFNTRYVNTGGQDFFFSMEFPMIEWLEENGYDISYVSEADV